MSARRPQLTHDLLLVGPPVATIPGLAIMTSVLAIGCAAHSTCASAARCKGAPMHHGAGVALQVPMTENAFLPMSKLILPESRHLAAAAAGAVAPRERVVTA